MRRLIVLLVNSSCLENSDSTAEDPEEKEGLRGWWRGDDLVETPQILTMSPAQHRQHSLIAVFLCEMPSVLQCPYTRLGVGNSKISQRDIVPMMGWNSISQISNADDSA